MMDKDQVVDQVSEILAALAGATEEAMAVGEPVPVMATGRPGHSEPEAVVLIVPLAIMAEVLDGIEANRGPKPAVRTGMYL